MAKYIRKWQQRYPKTIETLVRVLPNLEIAQPKVWKAFLANSTLDGVAAAQALSFNSSRPLLWFRDLGGIDGQFDPDDPKRIKINAELARQYEALHDQTGAERYLCGTVLPEKVHWGRFHHRRDEPRALELAFEVDAYEEALTRFWGEASGRPAPSAEAVASILDHGPRAPEAVPVNNVTLTAGLPRGIRNNNPGNIKRGGDRWQGLATFDEMTAFQRNEQVFCVFTAPEWGIRAMARILLNYQRKHALHTASGMVNRWAPPSENDTGSYVRFVSNRMQVDPDEIIEFENDDVALPMMKAIIRQENSLQPYSDTQLLDGHRLALA